MNIRKMCAFLALAILLSLLPGVPIQVNATQEVPGETQSGDMGSDVMPIANEPTKKPTQKPTSKPTEEPTKKPTTKPTKEPTKKPTEEPTAKPTKAPTEKPTKKPTEKPTEPPTTVPTTPPEKGPMKSSDELIAVLKTMEGFHPVAYWDNTQWTIGYGTRCPAGKEKYYTKDNPMTEKEALALLHQELTSFEKMVNDYIEKHGLKLEQHQFDALVSFTYNCGGGWLKNTDGYLNIAIREGDMGNRFIYGMLLWSKTQDDYLLVNRRKCEANMYINGVYKAYNKPANIPQNIKHVFLDGNGGTVRYVPHGYSTEEPTKIMYEFTSIPTGVDKDGNTFEYTFAGWYTAAEGGKRIKKLDGSLPNGTVLFAHWKDPNGNVALLPKGDVVDNVEVTVTSGVNVRIGPGTYYPIKQELEKGRKIVIVETFKVSNSLWGKCELGWLSLNYTDYLDIVSGNTSIPTEGLWGTVTTENGDTVNVRTGPSTSYGIAYTVKDGDQVQIFALKSDGTLQWGQLEDGNWICMNYVISEGIGDAPADTPGGGDDPDAPQPEPEPGEANLESISIEAPPEKQEYVQQQDTLDLTGSVLRLTFSDGSTEMAEITRSMVTGFSNKKLGEIELTVSYEDLTTTFTVTIIKATVVFKNYDGTVLSSTQYEYGRTVKVPKTPTKPADKKNSYKFVGWDKKVIRCRGDRVYTAVFEAVPLPQEIVGIVATDNGDTLNARTGPGTKYDIAYTLNDKTKVTILETKSDGTLLWGKLSDGNWICMKFVRTKADTGDMDGDYVLNEDDAIYLLRHVIFPDKYPLSINADANSDGKVNEDDAIYLLRHVIFPDKYPLKL